MSNRIALISDDSDFCDFIKTKLELRKSDELFMFCFDEVPEKMDFLQSSVMIVNSENSKQKTIDLLKIFNSCTPIIVTAYNDDDTFKRKCYRVGMLDFIPLLTPDAEFRARMLPAFSLASILEKNQQYRNILVKNKIIDKNNEVFLDYENIIAMALEDIKTKHKKAVFGAISPDDKGKFLLKQNFIETLILNNIRKDDVLINFAPNKYYLIMYNTDTTSVQKNWEKISKNSPHKLYAGFVTILNQTKNQLINSAINKLYSAINSEIVTAFSTEYSDNQNSQNFKLRRNNKTKKLEKIVIPAFYRIQQKYLNRFSGINIEQSYSNGNGIFKIKGKYFTALFSLSNPGFSIINIDITLKKVLEDSYTKRISFEPDEFDESLLEDLLEQFIVETKNYIK